MTNQGELVGALTGLRINHRGGGAAAALLEMARGLARLATCPADSIGAIIARVDKVKGGYVVPLAVGWNAAPEKARTCHEAGCDAVPAEVELQAGFQVLQHRAFSRHVHAEEMAVAHAAKEGVSIAGAWLYCTRACCPDCIKLLAACGIAGVCFPRTWEAGTEPPAAIASAMGWAEECGLTMVPVALDPPWKPEATSDNADDPRRPGGWITMPLTDAGAAFLTGLTPDGRTYTIKLGTPKGTVTATGAAFAPNAPVSAPEPQDTTEPPTPVVIPLCDKCEQAAHYVAKKAEGDYRLRCHDHLPKIDSKRSWYWSAFGRMGRHYVAEAQANRTAATDTAVIDYADGDPTNNDLSNLAVVEPKDEGWEVKTAPAVTRGTCHVEGCTNIGNWVHEIHLTGELVWTCSGTHFSELPMVVQRIATRWDSPAAERLIRDHEARTRRTPEPADPLAGVPL
jgi:deoxycytidylate deaminase